MPFNSPKMIHCQVLFFKCLSIWLYLQTYNKIIHENLEWNHKLTKKTNELQKYKTRKKWEVKCKILMICHFHIVFSWNKSFFDSNYPKLLAIFVWQFFFFQRIKSQVKLSKINHNWLRPTKNVVNQTSSFSFQLSLGHKNNEWGLELSLG